MGGGRRPPLPYFGNWKEVPQFLGKNVLTGVIYGLNFPFKAPFLRVSWRIFPAWPFFFLLQMIVYRSALIPRKLPCPKIFLVTRLPLLLEVQENMCIAIVCFEVTHFEINLIFLIKPFFIWPKRQDKNLNILRAKRACKVK